MKKLMEGCNIMKRKIVIVVNVDWFFVSHRLPIALEALKRGYEVYLLANDTGKSVYIKSLGIKFHQVPFVRSGKNPVKDLSCVFKLRRLFNQIKPDVIHNVTLKASLLSSIAAKLSGNKSVINAISGLGYTFTDGRDGLLQKVVKAFMNFAYRNKESSFILQNPDDLYQIKSFKFVPDQNLYLIRGSGIDLKEYSFCEHKNKQKLVFMLPARMLKDKGIVEFIEAANSIKSKYYDKAIFKLVGDVDLGNPTSLSKNYLESIADGEYIQWLGYQKEMKQQYVDSDIVVLPSYREGLPKSLIEANAIGRPIITTDVPGCRECVKHKVNGILIPVKNSEALAESFCFFIENPTIIKNYSRKSRILAEELFSLENVVNTHMEIYQKYFRKT